MSGEVEATLGFGCSCTTKMPSEALSVEPEIPTLCNFETFKDYKKARRVRNSRLLLLIVSRIQFQVVVVEK